MLQLVLNAHAVGQSASAHAVRLTLRSLRPPPQHMDEQLVGHTLVEMEEARVHAVVRGLAESDESNLQKVFAACAEYQHARKGLYRATHHKILGQLTKIFDTKPPATSGERRWIHVIGVLP